MAEARGFKNARQLGEATGLFPATVYRLWGDTARRIDKDTIDKLCVALDCEPGLLIKHQAGEKQSMRSKRLPRRK
ncbi:MAG TPA: helix-turn-helix transcriptional regulator [Blastocatellia bacterium]|nr:helix-turn-helix transcriptional regulator [Blastocatellia bacterium]